MAGPEALAVFGRAGSSQAELRAAVAQLGPAVEPAQFWSAIANDAAMPVTHRRMAVLQLLVRHVRAGVTTLGELGTMLDGAAWLRSADLTLVTASGGKLPLTWSATDTLVAVALPGRDRAVYLALAPRLGLAEIESALRGQSRDPRIVDALIRQVGFDGVD